MNPQDLTISELLQIYGAVMDELRRRDIVRSSNGPISDLAEILFCRAFDWIREGNSVAGHDAKDAAGKRYQIKARRISKEPGTRQLSAIRNLNHDSFEMLAGVLFSGIHRAGSFRSRW